ncbi:MAG: HAD hydrolase-like protein [Anaerotignaceae bacterium]
MKLNEEVILFDLDGTIIDSMEGILKGINYAFRQVGREELSHADFLPYMGPPITTTLDEVYRVEKEEIEKIMAFYYKYYEDNGCREGDVYEGIETLLKELKSKGKTLAVATNKLRKYALEILESKGLVPYFEYIGGTNVEKGILNKTQVIEDCLEVLKIEDRTNVVIIGDRKHDMTGAKNTGIRGIGITYGYGQREELEESGATIVLDSPQEVSKLF